MGAKTPLCRSINFFQSVTFQRDKLIRAQQPLASFFNQYHAFWVASRAARKSALSSISDFCGTVLIGEMTMPTRAKELSALDIKRAAHPGTFDRHHWIDVGGVAGLRLQISRAGAKSWVLRTTVGEKRKVIGLGAYPEVSLAEARIRARDTKAAIKQGIDPVEEKRAAKAALIAKAARTMTFEKAVDEWIAATMQARPEKSRKFVRSALARYAFPVIGKMTLDEVTTDHIQTALAEVWVDKHSVGAKVRGYLDQLFGWAKVRGLRSGPNPAAWAGNLKHLLDAPSRVEKGRAGNYPAVRQADLPNWWAELKKRDGQGALALRLAVLCACRSGEVRCAKWSEIDLGTGIWLIPASRMKAGADHRVALSAAAVDLLKSLPRTHDLVFPTITGKALSDMSVSAVMRRMQQDAEEAAQTRGEPAESAGWRDEKSGRPAVPHGLRSSFRDWAAEKGWDRDLAEIALAHKAGSAVERAYRRGDLIERRRVMMEAWSDFLEGRATGENVVPLSRSAG
jgi:integrase